MTAYHCNQAVICHWSEAIKWAVGYLNVELRDVKIWKRNVLKLCLLEIYKCIKSIRKYKGIINIKGIQDSDYFWWVRGGIHGLQVYW